MYQVLMWEFINLYYCLSESVRNCQIVYLRESNRDRGAGKRERDRRQQFLKFWPQDPLALLKSIFPKGVGLCGCFNGCYLSHKKLIWWWFWHYYFTKSKNKPILHVKTQNLFLMKTLLQKRWMHCFTFSQVPLMSGLIGDSWVSLWAQSTAECFRGSEVCGAFILSVTLWEQRVFKESFCIAVGSFVIRTKLRQVVDNL